MLPSEENLDRQRARLARHTGALSCLGRWGLKQKTIDRFNLGLKAPYRPRGDEPVIENALSFPIVGADGRRLSRFGFLNLEDITVAPAHPAGWGVGSPLSYWSGLASPALPLLVVPDVRTCWLLSQLIADSDILAAVILTRSHGSKLPLEWLEPAFWADWPSVFVLSAAHPTSCIGAEIASVAERPVLRLDAPHKQEWCGCLASGMSLDDLFARMAVAEPWNPKPTQPTGPQYEVGDFAFEPVNIATACRDGQLFYPFLVEERALQSAVGRPGEREFLVASYAVRVLRSDGQVLKVQTLPSPRGAGEGSKVYILSDGTRLVGEPPVSRYASWSYGSIKRYVEARCSSTQTPHRSLALIAGDVLAYLRSSIWLPNPDDYHLAAAYVLLSYVFPVFDAVPLLLIHGPKGSGKTELGQALADLSCNGVMVGQSSAAGLIRLMQESRGLLVLDDLERIGISAGAGFSEIAQMLKLSYKRSSATKPVADRVGSVAILDFFGPKCITNTRGVDEVLGSRMVRIATASAPVESIVTFGLGPDNRRAQELRDELHCWGMASAPDVLAAYSERLRRSDRRQEIEAPLRVLGHLVGPEFERHLTLALGKNGGRSARPGPEQRLALALEACGSLSAVTIQQLQLELALADPSGDPMSPETIGRLLSSAGHRKSGSAVRIRLNGVLCRVVELTAPAGNPSQVLGGGPLEFCREQTCDRCRYRAVCPLTLPEFYNGKRRPGLAKAHGGSAPDPVLA